MGSVAIVFPSAGVSDYDQWLTPREFCEEPDPILNLTVFYEERIAARAEKRVHCLFQGYLRCEEVYKELEKFASNKTVLIQYRKQGHGQGKPSDTRLV